MQDVVEGLTSIEVVRELSELPRHRRDWERIWAEGSGRFPCTHPTWIIAWYESFAADVEPVVIIGYRHGAIAAVAPLMRMKRDVAGFRTGDVAFAAYNTIDYAEVLGISDADRTELLLAGWRHAGERGLFLQNVRSDTDTERCIHTAFPGATRLTSVSAPFVSFDVFEKGALNSFLRDKSHQNFRKRKRAEKAGLIFYPAWSMADENVDWFAGQSAFLQVTGLASKGTQSNFRDPRLVGFYSVLLRRMRSLGALRVGVVLGGSRLVAFRVGFNIGTIRN